MSDINDLIGLAIDKNPVDFAEKFNDILSEKIGEALEARSFDTATSLYAEEVDEEDDLDEDFDDDFDEDFDEDFDDEDDLDEDFDDELDLDDLDITDLDDEIEEI